MQVLQLFHALAIHAVRHLRFGYPQGPYQAGEDQGVSEEPNNSDDENTVEAEFEEVKEEDSK